MEKQMYERTAIITGSTRGIGLAIAKQLGEDGYQIVMVGTQQRDKYPEQIDWFKKRHIPLLYIQADISTAKDRKKIVENSIASFGTIDILINNAGIAPKERKDLLDLEEASFDRLISVNTKGPLFLTQLVAKAMIAQPKEQRECKIVFITSCSSVTSSPNRAEYCISKAGTSMVSTLFADRLASENILVNEVRPGVIQTDMTDKVKDKYDALFDTGLFPLARWGQPEDVAQVVSALCSNKFMYSTGSYIDVDGGFHIPRL